MSMLASKASAVSFYSSLLEARHSGERRALLGSLPPYLCRSLVLGQDPSEALGYLSAAFTGSSRSDLRLIEAGPVSIRFCATPLRPDLWNDLPLRGHVTAQESDRRYQSLKGAV